MATDRRQAQLQAKIAKLKTQLLTLGDLRPGTLSQQYNVCGKPGCQCKADPPRRHGPYYQVSFTWQGRSQSQFVRRAEVATVRQQLRTHQRLRKLVEAWITAGLALSRLRQGVSRRAVRRSSARRSPGDRQTRVGWRPEGAPKTLGRPERRERV